MAKTRRLAHEKARQRHEDLERQVERHFREAGEEFDVDVDFLSENPPTKPNFPIIMVCVAFLKDLLDFLDLTIILMILTTLLSVILTVVLLIWTYFRMSGGWWKRKMIASIWIRYIAVVVVEFIPFFKIVPATTIFVLMTHYKESKIVQLLDQSLEMITRFHIKSK